MSLAKKKLHEDNRIDNWSYLWMAMFTAVGFLLFNVFYSFFGAFVLKIIAAVIIVALIGGLLYSKWKKSDSERKTIYVILLISIILKLCYVIVTSGMSFSGQDYKIFSEVQTNLTLPEAFQPLYYICAAAVYNLSALLSFTQPYAMDIVRIVTEYMGIVAAIAVYYILCELEANDSAVYIGTSIIAFHPGLIRLGGEISPLVRCNDSSFRADIPAGYRCSRHHQSYSCHKAQKRSQYYFHHHSNSLWRGNMGRSQLRLPSEKYDRG